MTISGSFYKIILTYSELISNSIHTFTELLRNNGEHFFESFNGHLNRQKSLKKNFVVNIRKVSIRT